MHEDRARYADMQLRGNTRPLPARVYWPGHGQPTARPAPLLVFCVVGGAGAGAEATCRALSSDAGLVVLSVSCGEEGPRDGITVLEWTAEHAAELGADPLRLLVGGEEAGAAVAAAVALEAGGRGWPVIARQVLINPASLTWPVAGLTPQMAAATVATVAGHPQEHDEACAALLREAGVAVDELHCTTADLGQAIRRSLGDESGWPTTSF